MRHTRTWWTLAAAAVTLSLVAAACGDDKTTTATPSPTTPTVEKSLVGMKGTTPLVDLGAEFKTRMTGIDPTLVDFNYGAESYDAVIIIALATAEAKDDGSKAADKINGITRGGEKCTDFKTCAGLIAAGKDIDYDGVSGPLEFSGNGEPTEASYGVLQFGSDCTEFNAAQTKAGKPEQKSCIDNKKTEFVKATAPKEADVPQEPVTAPRTGDGVLKIGTLLPLTGSLAFLGPPEFAGVKLAIQEINAAGGVLGKPVECECAGDSGDTANKKAPDTVAEMLSKNVDALIGAASSSVTLSVIDTITTAGVTMFSPANTAKKLSTYADKGLYFRDAPSDILQGQVLGDQIVKDGKSKVFILALNDDYGTGLAEDLTKSLTGGGATVVNPDGKALIYDPKAADYKTEVQAAKDAQPDAIVIIGFDETSKILGTMVEQGVSASLVYGVDGNMGNALAAAFEAGK